MQRFFSIVFAVIAMFCFISPARAVILPPPALDATLAAKPAVEEIVFAGGCFWGVQAVFQHTKGVLSATSGYSGGTRANAHYDMVGHGDTSHAEAVRVKFDPSQITLGQLLQIFFSVAHDPTELNKQGPDHGTQYRSAIFTITEEQERIAHAYIVQLDAAKAFKNPIVTKIQPLDGFYPAEDYHQNFVTEHPGNGYVIVNDAPKLVNLKATFPQLYTETLAPSK